ncbi:MAG: hypothetical protein Q4A61_01925 [Porphyromonadaceae bacterium]|nr:hypothetical protein [Porphyromonadaceae bacterium]
MLILRSIYSFVSNRSWYSLLLLWLGMLLSCSRAEQVAPVKYIPIDSENEWSATTPVRTSICVRKGREPISVAVYARYDHRIQQRDLTLELKLHRWGLVWAADTITLSMNEYFDGNKGRRPMVYEAEGSDLWQFTPPIAGVYQIETRPLMPERPVGVLALGLLDFKQHRSTTY